mmetsp:Transcript_14201/g.23629  ORF Transcript_14201/g.23629 Transcript_14201/m.23629 type:complete len:307 (-) Transcript_14201:134-1054(-)
MILLLLLTIWVGIVIASSRNEYAIPGVFDPSGRLHQIEAAFKSAERGSTILAINSDDHVVIMTWQPSDSAIEEPSMKLVRLSKTMGLCATGIVADAHYLSQQAFKEVLTHQRVFGSVPVLSRLSHNLADQMHKKTLSLASRPFGVMLCIFGFDTGKAQSQLYQVTPSGSCRECSVFCTGRNSEKLLASYKKQHGKRLPTGNSLVTTVQSVVDAVRNVYVTRSPGIPVPTNSVHEDSISSTGSEVDDDEAFAQPLFRAQDVTIHVLGKDYCLQQVDGLSLCEAIRTGDFQVLRETLQGADMEGNDVE